MLLEDVEICCPYCGETYISSVDGSAGNQEYIEDCYVCCRPIMINVEFDPEGKLVNFYARQENE